MTTTTYYVEGDIIVEDNGSSRFPALQVNENYPGDPAVLLQKVMGILNGAQAQEDEKHFHQMEAEESGNLVTEMHGTIAQLKSELANSHLISKTDDERRANTFGTPLGNH